MKYYVQHDHINTTDDNTSTIHPMPIPCYNFYKLLLKKKNPPKKTEDTGVPFHCGRVYVYPFERKQT